ncbi:MAG: MBL fold metallo-hydrolase [Gemmatimonadota bacterium]|nr:MBL fold metallo-hydrolase [Gemmatimonadota bacterium]
MLIGEGRGIRVHAIDAGDVRLDGGSMFGVVPKTLWSRGIEADERNRIPMKMRCLLVETPERRILVDTGAGNKTSEKLRAIYGIDNEGEPTRLETSLQTVGVEPEDVDLVVATHLHFDHAGGQTTLRDDGSIVPAFPNARYVIRRGEWHAGHSANRRIRSSYTRADFDPLEEACVLELVEGDQEIVPDVLLVGLPGHTADHQGVLIDLGEEIVWFPCDLVPTSAHLRLSWIMAYDLEPLVTLATKERWLTRAGREGWRIVFPHDHAVVSGRAAPSEKGVGCVLEDIVNEPGFAPVNDRGQG